MKLAKEIAEAILDGLGWGGESRAGTWRDEMLPLIAAKLEPIREALEEAVWVIDSAGDEQEEGAAQSGPKFWHNQALLIGDVLAMLSEEE